MSREDPAIRELIALGERYDEIRAVILTSSRANPDAPRDILSDYDAELYVSDFAPFAGSDDWFEALGTVLVVYREDRDEDGYRWHTRLVLYEDGTKIDFQVGHVDALKAVCTMDSLPNEYDIGYQVLLDKDGVTASLKRPTYRAYIPAVPTESDYAALVNDFWWDSAYVSRYLWRDDLMAVKLALDQSLKQDMLRKMLEWSIEIERGWNWKPGHFGRGISKALDRETAQELAESYAGGDIEELWESLFRTAALFRKVAIRVGESLGYRYPHDLDERVMIYHGALKDLDRRGASGDELARLLRERYRERRP
jgi:aminoglycoside 6-adenylyltransferase